MSGGYSNDFYKGIVARGGTEINIDSMIAEVVYNKNDIKEEAKAADKLVNRGICPVCGVGMLKISTMMDAIGCDCGFKVTKADMMNNPEYEGRHIKEVVLKESVKWLRQKAIRQPDGSLPSCPNCKTSETLTRSKNGSVICEKCLTMVIDKSKKVSETLVLTQDAVVEKDGSVSLKVEKSDVAINNK